MKRIIVFSLVAIVLFSSCGQLFGKRVRGNGNITTETKSLSDFDGISVSGSIDVYVRQEPGFDVKVVADENLQSYVILEKEGSQLHIYTKRGINLKPTKSIKVYVSAPGLNRFKASGACDINSENSISNSDRIVINLSGACDVKMDVQAPKIETDLSGAGTISLSGRTKDFYADGSGSTNIKCYDLLAENVIVKLSGAGDAQVFASVSLDVNISGAADVKYKGSPTISQRISGAGSIKKVD